MPGKKSWLHGYACTLASIPWETWEALGYQAQDGMFIRWGSKVAWAPITEAQCLEILRNDPAQKAYYDAYTAGDYEKASRIYRQSQRKPYIRKPGIHRQRRSRLKNAFGSHSQAEWEAILKKYRYRCASCGLKAKLEKDHIVPLCAGGSNLAVNLQPLCKSCNSAKSGRIQIGTQFGIFDQVNIRETQGQIIKRGVRSSKSRARDENAVAEG